jgi:AraC-like DNA-binding protein
MEPQFLRKNTKTPENSFYCRYAEVPYTYDQFHYHKEFELLYILKNNGTRFIGDSIESFNNHDLVLVGPGLPHYWQSDTEFYQNNEELKAKVIVIHFELDFLGQDFFEIPEMNSVKILLSKASRGIHFPEEAAKLLGEKLLAIPVKNDWLQITELISALCMMAECNYKTIASESFSNSYHQSNNEDRITGIYNYLIQNHHDDISLSDVADFANMNTSAFCRYFKKVTSKTFSDSLNDIRIGIACKKLINTELSIAEIGYSCGYQSISYFNRQFKKVKGYTPSDYRMMYMNNTKFTT